MNIEDIKNILTKNVIPFIDINKNSNLLKNKLFFLDFHKKFDIFRCFPELKYLIDNINNLENLHIFCPVCGNKNKFLKYTKGYSNHCSVKCAHNSDIVKNKTLKTCEERYGVKYTTQSRQMKDKSNQTKLQKYGDEKYNNRPKMKQTKKERYGDENYHNIEKMKKTNLQKYGREFYTQTEDYLIKSKKTNLNKYGVDNVFKSDLIKGRIRQSNLEKYGVEFPMQLESYRQNYQKVCMEKYGVKNGFLLSGKNKAERISKLNKQWGQFLDIKDEDYEFCLNGKFFDLKKDNTLIEINPTITHNSFCGVPWVKNSIPLDKDYHLQKSILGKNNNYRVLHIWDWDDKEKIKYLLQEKKIIYARKCKIKEINNNTCSNFLNKYHLQSSCKGQTIRYGLFYKDELVQVMTFGKPRYNKNFKWELLRLCSHKDYKIVGGSEKLFKHFLKNNNGNIISYCDNSKFKGDVYLRLGFKLKNNSKPSRHWFNIKEKVHITDNLLKQLGFDKLFNANFGKGTSNEKLMLEHNFLYIYDCGQGVYEFNI